MKLPDGLRGIRQLAFDTAPLIYFVERHPLYFERMVFIMRYIDTGPIDGVASTVALAEVQIQPLRSGNAMLAKQYEDILTLSAGFRLEAVSIDVARRAGDLRARYNLLLADALHIATAIETHCDAFLTNDKTFKRVQEIRVLVLDELEV